jgi:hypothetical protein
VLSLFLVQANLRDLYQRFARDIRMVATPADPVTCIGIVTPLVDNVKCAQSLHTTFGGANDEDSASTCSFDMERLRLCDDDLSVFLELEDIADLSPALTTDAGEADLIVHQLLDDASVSVSTVLDNDPPRCATTDNQEVSLINFGPDCGFWLAAEMSVSSGNRDNNLDMLFFCAKLKLSCGTLIQVVSLRARAPGVVGHSRPRSAV